MMLRSLHKSSGNKRRPTGFSLVELLTAMAITTLLMFTLFSMVGQSSTNYRLAKRKVNTLADSRALFHFLEKEIASRVVDTKFFLQTHPPKQSEFAFIHTRDAQDSDATGDLMSSMYYVAFTADDSHSGSPKLYRRTLDGADTQQLIEAGDAAPFPSYDPTTDDPIAYNIVSFKVQALQRDQSGEWQTWNNTSGTAAEMLEITVETMDDFSAQRLTQATQWSSLADSTDPHQREALRRHIHRIPLSH